MVLFFVRAEVDSDTYIRYCYSHYRSITGTDVLPEKAEIIREGGKKPRLDAEGVHFSLSHSAGVTVVAMSHSEIGADIEKIRPIDRKKFAFIEADGEEEFFREWTRREAYVKCTGRGLQDIRKDIPEDAHFEQFEVFEGYIFTVCAEEQSVVAYELDPASVM